MHPHPPRRRDHTEPGRWQPPFRRQTEGAPALRARPGPHLPAALRRPRPHGRDLLGDRFRLGLAHAAAPLRPPRHRWPPRPQAGPPGPPGAPTARPGAARLAARAPYLGAPDRLRLPPHDARARPARHRPRPAPGIPVRPVCPLLAAAEPGFVRTGVPQAQPGARARLRTRTPHRPARFLRACRRILGVAAGERRIARSLQPS